jgi:hypothetical protein
MTKKTPRKKNRGKKTADEEHDVLNGWKKTPPKKTPSSNRRIYPTFRTALTLSSSFYRMLGHAGFALSNPC